MVAPRLDDPLTREQLRALLTYIPSTGAFFWKHNPDRAKDWNTQNAGQMAGTPTVPKGYIQIMVNKRLYLAHRLAYLWMTGGWPPAEIDHKDGNRANNAWRNLRAATRSQNGMNNAMRSDNASGYKGVYWSTTKRRWVSVIFANSKRHYIGYFDTAEDAHIARIQFAKRLHGEFARTK